ncbi:MAG TPA: DNA (cytosine-5-)-methyltransferase [Terriglobales bacterium]|nr:DNA (cytosine-5-)-methyltransferase [Terriglobales bacterium]
MRRTTFKFIDLFAGIGGMRLAFERLGCCRCVFSSEWDKYAQETYRENFGETPAGDITKIPSSEIPTHDITLAGFPCQPFSISGVSKKKSLGRPHGFEDVTQGTLFFDVARIIRDKQPKAFVLENVKNLIGHDRGKTFSVIYRTLADELGYDVHFKVLDAKYFVPQHRERIFIVGFREPRRFSWPIVRPRQQQFRSVLQEKTDPKYVLSDHLWSYLQRYAEKHRAAGNGFGFGLVDLEGICRTLSARYYKDGSEILIPRGPGQNPRRLTPRECAALMGFPRKFRIPVSDTQAYKQFGNSVVVPMVHAIAREVVRALRGRIYSKRLFPDPDPYGRIHKAQAK